VNAARRPAAGPVAAVSFDLDDTLWPVWPAIERAERELHEYLLAHAPLAMAGHDTQSLRRTRDALWLAHPELGHDFSALRRLTLRSLLEPHGGDEALIDAAFEVFYAARNRVTLYADAEPALDALGALFPLVSLTNGNADLERIGLAPRFAARLCARTVGAPKPDPRCFAAVASALDLAPAQVAHVGDDVELDVCGAQRAGLVGVWLNRNRQRWPHAQRPDIEIVSLAELAPALSHWNARAAQPVNATGGW